MDELKTILFLSTMQCVVSFFLVFGAIRGKVPRYGKHATSQMIGINPRLAWMVQECPSFCVPLYMFWMSDSENVNLANRVVLGLFILHYFYRSFIYPSLLNSNASPVPFQIVISACIFTGINGFIVAKYELSFGKLSDQWLHSEQCVVGLLLWAAGVFVNVHSDSILRNLRKPNDRGHKIPRGGMFEYVSAANYFGEIVEWIGLAVASNFHFPLTCFALSTAMGIGSRGVTYHKFYLEKFEDYPRNRKAVIPFIL